MTTWRESLLYAMELRKESMSDIEFSTLSEDDMDREFDDGYGANEGCTFTVWTKSYVYFPACYDGSEWVASVARNPDGKPTNHIGGG